MLSHVHYNTNRVLLVVISVYIRAVRKIFKMPGYTGYKYCAVKDCDTSTKNKTASVNLRNGGGRGHRHPLEDFYD